MATLEQGGLDTAAADDIPDAMGEAPDTGNLRTTPSHDPSPEVVETP